MTKHTITIDENTDNQRLDKVIATTLSDEVSRERIKQLINDNLVTVDNASITKASTKLKTGQIITVTIPEAEPIQLEAENIPLEILFEDEHLLVLNKPSGMLSHPTGKEKTGTLVNALLHHCHGQLSGINGELRPGIVHRLDRQTAGLMMAAKSDIAHRGLSEQLQNRTAKREYRAIAQGNPLNDKGMINLPIGRNPQVRDKMMVNGSASRPAVTYWQVQERFHDKFFLAQANLATGRTHQIRVHFAHRHFPLIGDPLYGTGVIKQMTVPKPLKNYGQFLQAVKLNFTHPISKESMAFEIPLAPEMEEMLTYLRQ